MTFPLEDADCSSAMVEPYQMPHSVSACIAQLARPASSIDLAMATNVLQWSRDCGILHVGMFAHDAVIRLSWDNITSLVHLLVQMYAQCGSVTEAVALFRKAKSRSTSLWNFLVKYHAVQGYHHEAFRMFDQMQLDGAMPSKSTCIRLLSTCCTKDHQFRGKKLHEFIKKSPFRDDIFIMTAIVRMYGKCGSLEGAEQTHREMQEKDAVSYTTMIGVYADHGRGIEAIQLLKEMEEEGLKPDKVTFVSALDACTSCSLLAEGENLHIWIKQYDLELDVVVETALINMYGKCGKVDVARALFNKMPERNVISWNTMISAYAQHKQGKEALNLMEQMQHANIQPDRVTLLIMVDVCANCCLYEQGEQMHRLILDYGLNRDVAIGNALVNMYGRCGDLEKAWGAFHGMAFHDVVSWNTMITMHAQLGQGSKVLQILNQLQQEGQIPDNVSFVSVFDALACCSALSDGKRLHSCMIQNKMELDVVVGTAILNMYGKCNNIEDSRIMFDTLLEKNVITCNAMISLCTQHDNTADAFQIVSRMQTEGINPDEVSFSCILEACARAGALTQGERMHLLITEAGYQLDSVVGTSLVYMYGKCGKLNDSVQVFKRIYGQEDTVLLTVMEAVYAQHGRADEAMELLHQWQQKGLELDDIIFVSILTACSHSGLIEEACFYFSSMMLNHCIFPAIEHYVSLIDVFGRAGLLDEAEIILNQMPIHISTAPFLSVLGACMYHIDVKHGKQAAMHILEIDSGISPYITLSNIYVAATHV